ncbi:MAG TPA: ABC transporter ATP-binding protein [Verrucomicrobiales bacterium]|nr:ABC transporter ATP-binding protein [Verrucomicrobiales bacterium]
MSAAAIEIRDLRVDYGNFVAVNDISLSVPAGEVCGLVGPNGAGKTSTFKVLTTLMHPTYGEVRLCDMDLFVRPEAAREVLGYMPDFAPVPSDLQLWEFLDLFAHSHGIGSPAQRSDRIAQCLEEVHLTDKRNAWCRELSRGQTQRLVLAKTLLHRPRVMVLDEPASGMDPLSRRDLRLTLRKLAASGVAIIVSSHILSELADMCTSLCVMNQGRILAAGPVDEVREKLGNTDRTLTITVLPDTAALAQEVLAQLTAGRELTRHGNAFSFRFHGSGEEQAALLSTLLNAGIKVRAFEEQKSSFEDILVQVAEANRSSR